MSAELRKLEVSQESTAAVNNSGKGPPRPPIDANPSIRWRTSNGPVGSTSGRPPVSQAPSKRSVRLDPCVVEESDLASLSEIQDLLRALNDAYAGGGKIEALVDKVPVLRARCLRRARKRSPAKIDCTLKEAMTLIGNIGLESELLQLLEDLTILRSETDEKAGSNKPPR